MLRLSRTVSYLFDLARLGTILAICVSTFIIDSHAFLSQYFYVPPASNRYLDYVMFSCLVLVRSKPTHKQLAGRLTNFAWPVGNKQSSH
ncbi:hypothetical protein K469DRAFT_119916 [Zopfia rhizophila CBS 207.26]|uniref:Uncharacterized protein n=1 Tax=Zopfia rhizophila CBS 207.26 TaxID=1314779 RepID=A0A6A6E4T2_9PEZI|nr:hypothetical protein K469DRAFT_119916 [Zopfia rhizophila CBS 207.26]